MSDSLDISAGSFRIASPKVLRSSVVAMRCQVDRSIALTNGGTGGRFGALPKRAGGAFGALARSPESRPRAKTAMAGSSPGVRRSVAEIKLEMDDFMRSPSRVQGGAAAFGFTYTSSSSHHEVHEHNHDQLALIDTPKRSSSISQRTPSSAHLHQEHATAGSHAEQMPPNASPGDYDVARTYSAHDRSELTALNLENLSVGDVMGSGFAGDMEASSSSIGKPKVMEFKMSHQYDHLLPSSNSKRNARTPDLMWQSKKMLPPGVMHSNQIEKEAACVFAEGSDVRRDLTRPGKFVEANSFKVRLAEMLMKAQWIREQPPAKDSKTRFNAYMSACLFGLLEDLSSQLGPFGSVLGHIKNELYPFVFSDQPQAMNIPGLGADSEIEEMMGYTAWVEVVEMQKREADRVAATLTSASMLTSKAAKDVEKYQVDNKQLARKVSAMDDKIVDLIAGAEIKENKHKLVLAEHNELRRRFQELQRGFLLGHLQDEVHMCTRPCCPLHPWVCC